MEDSRTARLQHLLRRLGKAVHGTVAGSEEVHSCLRDLKAAGWDAVMLVEASVACSSGTPEARDGSIRIHVDAEPERVSYLLNPGDAHLLESLGISPTRYRSAPASRRADTHDESDR